jgi:hypothetical protein
MVGRHERPLWLGWLLIGGAVVLAAALVVVIGSRGSNSSESGASSEDACQSPPVVKTHGGVTLQPDALAAFRRAQRATEGAIHITSSYRSCAQQVLACQSICGNANGCPGTCVKPGLSYHQLGLAVDLTQGSLDTPGVIRAMEDADWCQAVPDTDPGHFSYHGCH